MAFSSELLTETTQITAQKQDEKAHEAEEDGDTAEVENVLSTDAKPEKPLAATASTTERQASSKDEKQNNNKLSASISAGETSGEKNAYDSLEARFAALKRR